MKIEYLNNKVFQELILRFCKAKNIKRKRSKKDALEFDNIQIELAAAFYTLAKNIIRAFNFKLVDKDEALQEGVMICFEKLHRFDPNKGAAFNFATTIILNHYRQLYRAAKNYNELKVKYFNHLNETLSEDYVNKLKSKKKNKYKINDKDDER